MNTEKKNLPTDGLEVEKIFENLMKSLGFNVKKSKKNQDMFDHIDFICDGITYDVKAHKKFNRWDV